MKTGFFGSLHQVLRDMDAKPRPHFGKHFNISAWELKDVYPKYSDFQRIREKLDPSAIFLNRMLGELFQKLGGN